VKELIIEVNDELRFERVYEGEKKPNSSLSQIMI
jgi:hypothetical protein